MTKLFFKLVVPSIFVNVIGFFIVVTNMVFAGHMNDPTKLAAVGLSQGVNNIMVEFFLIGINSAQETLTSQAFGHGNLHLCGVYLNRGFLIFIVFFILLAITPVCFAEPILVAIG